MFQVKLDESNSTRRRIPVLLVDATDGYTPETGLSTFTVNVSQNGTILGSQTQTLTEVGNGIYYYTLGTGAVNTLGWVTVNVSATGCRQYNAIVQIMAYDAMDSTGLGLSRIDTNIGSRQATVTFPANFGDLAITASTGRVTVGTNADKTDYSLLAGSISSGTFGTGAITASALATDAAQEIADAVWDEPMSGHTTNDTYGNSVLRAYNNTNAYLKTTGAGAGHVGADVHEIQNDVITGAALADSAGQDIADQILGRNIAGGSSTGRLVKDSLRFLRNRFTLVGDVLTVYAEDDTTIAWTAVVSTDETALPITGSNPAGGAA